MVDKLQLNPVNNEVDFRKYIKFEDNCISQIIDYIPDKTIIYQACEILFYIIERGYKQRFRSKEIFFLSLLYNSTNIKEIINRISKSDKKYNIICCKTDNLEMVKNIDREIRLKLSENAINSMDSLL